MHNTFFGKELTRLGFKIHKSNKGNSRIGIGLKQPSPMMGDVASTVPMYFPVPVMHSKHCEVAPN